MGHFFVFKFKDYSQIADKLTMKYAVLLFSAFLLINAAIAGSRGSLVLRAQVGLSVNTIITTTELSSTKSVWVFSSQINSKYMLESQKFEIEGLDQTGVESHLKQVTGNDRIIQYELLVKHLSENQVQKKPIFLKISAN